MTRRFTLFRTCWLRDGFKYPAGQVSRLTFLATSARWRLPVPDPVRFWAFVAIVIIHAAPPLTDRKKMRVVHAWPARRSTVASAAPLDQLDVISFDCIAIPSALFRGNQRGSATEERVEYNPTARSAVGNRVCH
jgi:hypothetical protein